MLIICKKRIKIKVYKESNIYNVIIKEGEG
jgi:hypothetical protein